jgi:hypothetical protein
LGKPDFDNARKLLCLNLESGNRDIGGVT